MSSADSVCSSSSSSACSEGGRDRGLLNVGDRGGQGGRGSRGRARGQSDERSGDSEEREGETRPLSPFSSASKSDDETCVDVCRSCKKPIRERHLLKVRGFHRPWHVRCLRCCVCKVRLDSEASCFYRGNNIYCKHDYLGHRFCAVKCSKCERALGPSDWVRKARDHLYHLACFACDACKRQLSTGEEFALLDDRLLCKTHYVETATGATSDNDGEDGSVGHKQKTKRVRTSFTEDQLRVLHANFRIDNNPDGQDLERIAQQTGLSKRVTQVWFQNSRARQKKHQQTPPSTTQSPRSSNSHHQHNNNNNNNNNNKNLSQVAAGLFGTTGGGGGGGGGGMRGELVSPGEDAYNINTVTRGGGSPAYSLVASLGLCHTDQQTRFKLEDALQQDQGPPCSGGYPFDRLGGLLGLATRLQSPLGGPGNELGAARRLQKGMGPAGGDLDRGRTPESCFEGYYPTDTELSN